MEGELSKLVLRNSKVAKSDFHIPMRTSFNRQGRSPSSSSIVQDNFIMLPMVWPISYCNFLFYEGDWVWKLFPYNFDKAGVVFKSGRGTYLLWSSIANPGRSKLYNNLAQWLSLRSVFVIIWTLKISRSEQVLVYIYHCYNLSPRKGSRDMAIYKYTLFSLIPQWWWILIFSVLYSRICI